VRRPFGRTSHRRLETGQEGPGAQARQDLAGAVGSGPDLRLGRIEERRHVEPAQRLVPDQAEVAPGAERLAVEGEGVGRMALERGYPGADGRPVGLDRRAVDAGPIEGREFIFRTDGVARRERGPRRKDPGGREGGGAPGDQSRRTVKRSR